MDVSKPHLKDLNPEQLRAVQHLQGPLLIFAGAGSGKTRVLTRRIANLVLEGLARTDEILAVTFTNKAAREMQERVGSALRENGLAAQRRISHHSRLWVSTFHSTCSRILRQHAELLNYSPQFAIYDTSDTRSLLKKVYKELGIDPRSIDPRSVLNRIDRAKNNYRFADSFRDTFSEDSFSQSLAMENSAFADIYQAYQDHLLQANAMDFGDLLCNVVTLFTLEPKLLQRYQERFRYVMVDEYQDTNHVQYKLIHMISQAHENLCVVGDDDQSIYAFRGASIENILSFKNDYPEAETITLNQNYRSTKNILTAASSVIARNRKRQKKQLRTDNPRGELIRLYVAYDEKEEARYVAEEISRLRTEGTSLDEIAVFYRTNAQSRALEEALCGLALPYEIYGGFRFYDRKEIKDILAYYRLLLNPQDNEAFLRVINTPARGLGTTSVAALISYANRLSMPLLPALEHALTEEVEFVGKGARKKFQVFFDCVQKLKAETEAITRLYLEVQKDRESETAHSSNVRQALAGLIKLIAEESGYFEYLDKQDTPEAQSKKENILELCSVALDFSENALLRGEELSLQGFLDRASLASDLDKDAENQDTTSGTISLMTLHLAKGLEFDVVFFVGLEEGILPHARSYEERGAIEEERRLCYVGMTRARKLLYLSRAMERHQFGGSSWNAGQVSRFLSEIPEELITHQSPGTSSLNQEAEYHDFEIIYD